MFTKVPRRFCCEGKTILLGPVLKRLIRLKKDCGKTPRILLSELSKQDGYQRSLASKETCVNNCRPNKLKKHKIK